MRIALGLALALVATSALARPAHVGGTPSFVNHPLPNHGYWAARNFNNYGAWAPWGVVGSSTVPPAAYPVIPARQEIVIERPLPIGGVQVTSPAPYYDHVKESSPLFPDAKVMEISEPTNPSTKCTTGFEVLTGTLQRGKCVGTIK